MTWRRTKPLHRPTLRNLRAAEAFQRPLDATPVEPQRKRRTKMEEDVVDWDGIGGTDETPTD